MRTSIISSPLSKDGINAWKKHFNNQPDRACNKFEGIWRRTQDTRNALQSGWASHDDARRKIMHFCYEFRLAGNCLALDSPYLWLNLAFPKIEMNEYLEMAGAALKTGDWKASVPISGSHSESYRNGGLIFTVQHHGARHPVDEREGRAFPAGYENVSFTLSSASTALSKSYIRLPWDVVRSGIRERNPTLEPKAIGSLFEMRNFFPAHVELGCGPSIECGIPPLSELHSIFKVTDPSTGKFVLGARKGDTLIHEMLATPYEFLGKACAFFVKMVEAKPNVFYTKLKQMMDEGMILPPIFTNNFDRLLAESGLQEHYLRRYDEAHIFPEVQFASEAKSLLTVGAHADRRRLWAAARKAGLPVVHVDPEEYFVGGAVVKYPLEETHQSDFVIRSKSSKVFSDFTI
jgi:hypothetical protein